MTTLVFFFQAEDGIRDYKVTGVQTCALPISLRRISVTNSWAERNLMQTLREWKDHAEERGYSRIAEIGRASCRERVEIAEEAVGIENKRQTRDAEQTEGGIEHAGSDNARRTE